MNLENLVRQIVLDITLLCYFAEHGERQRVTTTIEKVNEEVAPSEGEVVAFLSKLIGGGGNA